MHTPPFGFEDTSYRHAGGEEGLTLLCRRFYEVMSSDKQAQNIRAMHSEDLKPMVDRLCAFLCGWLGGPRLYNERYGSLSIPRFHQKFPIGPAERDAWLYCMKIAVDEQPWRDDFKRYIMAQFAIPPNAAAHIDPAQRACAPPVYSSESARLPQSPHRR